jgi:hypothetical protein
MLRKKLDTSVLLMMFFSLALMTLNVLPVQLSSGSSTSPYQSGYNHGCSDVRISDPSERYINQPGKGPRFHTNEFMSGYNTGYNACSQDGDSDDTTASSKSPYRSGYDHGANDARDDCSDGCDWYILEPGKGFAFHTQEFIDGYIDGFCHNSPPGRGSDADEATFDCP